MAKVGELFISLRASTASFSKDLKRSTKLTKQSAQAMSKAFKIAAVAIAAAGAALAVLTKKSIDNADRMAKMSREIGISTEALSVLKREAELGGTNLETLSTGLQRLARNLSDAQNGLVTAQRAFGDLGIEVLDSNGKLRNLQEVTLEVATKFSQMEDGTRKTARAMELMGRGGVQLINTLNTLGEKGFAQARREAELFGEIVSTQTAVAAEKFNDNLRDLGAVVSGVGLTIAAELLPQLNRLTGSAIEFATKGKGAKRLAEKIAGAFKSIAAAGLTAAFAFNKLQQVIETVTGNERTKAAQMVARAQQQLLNVEQEIFLQERALNFKRKEDFDQAVENLKGLRRKLEQVQADLEGKKLFANLVGPPSFDPFFAGVESLEQLGEQIKKLFSDLAGAIKPNADQVKTSLDGIKKKVTDLKKVLVESPVAPPPFDENALISQRQEIEFIRRALGGIPSEVEKIGGAFQTLAPKLELLKNVGQQFTSSIASGFANLITRGGKLSDVFKNLASQLAGMLLQIALLNTLKSVFGGIGILGFQHGGRPQVGRPALVGEAGPELFVPDRSGSIISNQALQGVARGGGGKTVNINLTVNAPGAGPGTVAEIRRMLRVASKEILALSKAQVVESSLRSA